MNKVQFMLNVTVHIMFTNVIVTMMILVQFGLTAKVISILSTEIKIYMT